MHESFTPCAHRRYGSGSVLSEPHSGSPKAHFRNRACQIQSLFRRYCIWAFEKLDWIIKHDLFNLNYRKTQQQQHHQQRQHGGAASSHDQQEADPYKRKYGTTIPKNIPESSAWWKEQGKDLFALTEEHELGMMSCMVTITHNDLVPETLANIRRGPFSAPTQEEHVEYLFTRVRADRERSDFENYGMEHVISYQRRVAATKEHFMRRNHKTPLGIVRDFWDRSSCLFIFCLQTLLIRSPHPPPPPISYSSSSSSFYVSKFPIISDKGMTRTEAQMRAALHAHILVFFVRRAKPKDYEPNPPIARVVPASNPKQRPRDSQVTPQRERQEDNVYQEAHVGQITAEMVRPDVSGANWGGFGNEELRIAALARAIQCRLPYLHHCNAVYCLKDRPTCRFH